jgi:flagellar biogenesis protein FliO
VTATSDLAMLARVSASLLVVVVLAVLAARLARRASVRGPGVGLRVVDRVGVSREAAVAVVGVTGRALVLGITAHQVTLLTELDAELAAELLSPPAGGRRVSGPDPAADPPGRGRSSGSGSPLDPRTWRQSIDALRDLTARR